MKAVTTPGRRVHALSIDVEEYFHPNALDAWVDPANWDDLPARVEPNTWKVLDLLAEHDTRATFFILGWVAERFPSLVRGIAARGHEIACHGYAHRLAYRLGPDGFRRDVDRARKTLEDSSGAPVAGFRAASFSIVPATPWAIDILVEAGFAYDSSIFPVRHDIYGFPGFPRFPVRLRGRAGEITEIPASTVALFGRNWPVAGGGYLRLLPLSLTVRAIERIAQHDAAAAIVYIHPWEFDAQQPRFPAGITTRFRQYANLGRTEARLRHLLRTFAFAPLCEVFDLTSAPVYEPRWHPQQEAQA